MKKLNKYQWLGIGSILVFSIMYCVNCIKEKEGSNEHVKYYSLQVVDNEIKNGDDVLYRFIPVDGGSMDFTYKYSRSQSDGSKAWEDTIVVYNSQRVEISSLLIGETPVTVHLWEYVMNGKDSTPQMTSLWKTSYVNNKKAEEWKEFLNKLNELTGYEFRLPTNYEWEYAARGGQKSKNYIYAGSNDINEVAFYKGNVHSEEFVIGKEKAPNELGLYDMSGAVWELTTTCLPDIFPFFKLAGREFADKYVSRGGCFFSQAEECETRYIMSGWIDQTGARLIMKY